MSPLTLRTPENIDVVCYDDAAATQARQMLDAADLPAREVSTGWTTGQLVYVPLYTCRRRSRSGDGFEPLPAVNHVTGPVVATREQAEAYITDAILDGMVVVTREIRETILGG